MFKKIILKIRSTKKSTWILLLIMGVGIFLRTYNFRNWLYFGADQAHDAIISGDAAIGKTPWPFFGADMGNTNFFLGPMYYYFQIISAKIFGNNPEAMAYPDLLFSILTIPLLYFFLKKYFSKNISLTITGIYSLSFYVIRYSRFAWNPNPIPFFVILFLLALYEFLINDNKTSWKWIISLGIAIGVGIQLHAIILVLMPATAFCVFLFLVKKDWRIWKKWAVILLVVLMLNSGQIFSELKTNFANSKLFLASFNDKSQSGRDNLFHDLGLTVDCHIQANFHIVSSLGDQDNCTFYYTKLIGANSKANFDKIARTGTAPFIFLFLGAIFSLFAYVLLGYSLKTGKNPKRKCFLGLITLYLILYFIVMIVSIKAAPLRYFIPISFAPFLFLGLLFEFLVKKYPKKNLIIIFLTALFFVATNLISLAGMYQELNSSTRSSYKYVVLGEAQQMVTYMKSQIGSQKEAYFTGDDQYVSNFYNSLKYLSDRENFSLIQIKSRYIDKFLSENSVFYITKDSKIDGNNFEDYKNFGQVAIYKITN